tara:strand:+ start:1344 stop:1961 length:618 start_codon:yes stop_codon:yes gene_type:complete
MNLDMNVQESLNRLRENVERLAKNENAKEKSASLHRIINTGFVLIVLVLSSVAYFKTADYKFEYDYRAEVSQIVQDEGMVLNVYRDTLGNATVGFGHLVLANESFDTITPHLAIKMLKADFAMARSNVESEYGWADGDVKLVLINMSFQMGQGRLAKFEKALLAMRVGDYDLAAAELLDSRWANQTPKRAQRLAGRILALDNFLL